jgi:hypothetical protein
MAGSSASLRCRKGDGDVVATFGADRWHSGARVLGKVRWSGGPVVRWSGGPVVRWSGGPVVRSRPQRVSLGEASAVASRALRSIGAYSANFLVEQHVVTSWTITFLFSDVVGSTRLWAVEPDGMSATFRVHDDIFTESIANCEGYVFSMAGTRLSRRSDGPAPPSSARKRSRRPFPTWTGVPGLP